MPTIYERIAVCADTTWNALSAAEQAEYHYHYNTWTGFLGATKSDLVTINSGCREVIIWNDFGELPKFDFSAAQIGTNDANNFTIFRAHPTAHHGGDVNSGLHVAGAEYNYTMYNVLFDGIVFDEETDGTNDTGKDDSHFLSFNNNNANFENCIIANIYYAMYNLRTKGYIKNCLFYNWNVYFRASDTGTKFYNCGFYNTFAHTYTMAFRGGEFYNCWAYDTESLSDGIFHPDCTGDNNYASDGSGPIGERTLASFGFTDAANGDFSITSSSPLFDSGIVTGDEASTDITGGARIQGASIDIGPFELPFPTILTLEGVVVGSAVSVVDLDNDGFIVEPYVADTATEVMEFSLSTAVNVSVRVRNASGTTKYLPWSSNFLLEPSGATLYVNQLEDTIA